MEIEEHSEQTEYDKWGRTCRHRHIVCPLLWGIPMTTAGTAHPLETCLWGYVCVRTNKKTKNDSIDDAYHEKQKKQS